LSLLRLLEFWLLLGVAGLWPAACWALDASQVLVLANANAAKSVALARYYMKKRQIPDNNLLKLWVTDRESCSREAYDDDVARVVRQYLRERGPRHGIRCLVTMYGMPLKISPPPVTITQLADRDTLRRRRKGLERKLRQMDSKAREKGNIIKQELEAIRKKIEELTHYDQRAALDSELALVLMGDYPLSGWVPNPLFVGFKGKALGPADAQVLFVSRLDGPSPEIVRRIIDDSVAVERRGLAGIGYFDARWPRSDDSKEVEGYALYDKSIHLAANRVRKSGRMEVVLDERQALFQKGQCPNAALYCGWYSLAKYVDAFRWARGAVGYHIASSECTTLKRADSQVWCKRMLEEGVAATVGPTSEPYVQAFPLPEVFFGLLVGGRLSLVECYALSTPFLSWQMVLIGDPLYRPFGKG
jgi:uncharacterized protein (TIGR03790 family)